MAAAGIPPLHSICPVDVELKVGANDHMPVGKTSAASSVADGSRISVFARIRPVAHGAALRLMTTVASTASVDGKPLTGMSVSQAETSDVTGLPSAISFSRDTTCAGGENASSAGSPPALTFNLDGVLPQSASQVAAFQALGLPAVNAVLEGFHASVLAYGRSGSGKTHTIMGTTAVRAGHWAFEDLEAEETSSLPSLADAAVSSAAAAEVGSSGLGLLPRCLHRLLCEADAQRGERHFSVRLAVAEVYQRSLYDLAAGTYDEAIGTLLPHGALTHAAASTAPAAPTAVAPGIAASRAPRPPPSPSPAVASAAPGTPQRARPAASAAAAARATSGSRSRTLPAAVPASPSASTRAAVAAGGSTAAAAGAAAGSGSASGPGAGAGTTRVELPEARVCPLPASLLTWHDLSVGPPLPQHIAAAATGASAHKATRTRAPAGSASVGLPVPVPTSTADGGANASSGAALAKALAVLRAASAARMQGATALNADSSRSHVLFMIRVSSVGADGACSDATLTLVDLAGSESLDAVRAPSPASGGVSNGSGSSAASASEGLGLAGSTFGSGAGSAAAAAEAARERETKAINGSLHVLTRVVQAFANAPPGSRPLHVPYRESLLTTLLRDAIGGNSRTTIVVTLGTEPEQLMHSLKSCQFAALCKTVRNRVKHNTSFDAGQLLASLRAQLEAAQAALAARDAEVTARSEDSAKDLRFSQLLALLSEAEREAHAAAAADDGAVAADGETACRRLFDSEGSDVAAAAALRPGASVATSGKYLRACLGRLEDCVSDWLVAASKSGSGIGVGGATFDADTAGAYAAAAAVGVPVSTVLLLRRFARLLAALTAYVRGQGIATVLDVPPPPATVSSGTSITPLQTSKSGAGASAAGVASTPGPASSAIFASDTTRSLSLVPSPLAAAARYVEAAQLARIALRAAVRAVLDGAHNPPHVSVNTGAKSGSSRALVAAGSASSLAGASSRSLVLTSRRAALLTSWAALLEADGNIYRSMAGDTAEAPMSLLQAIVPAPAGSHTGLAAMARSTDPAALALTLYKAPTSIAAAAATASGHSSGAFTGGEARPLPEWAVVDWELHLPVKLRSAAGSVSAAGHRAGSAMQVLLPPAVSAACSAAARAQQGVFGIACRDACAGGVLLALQPPGPGSASGSTAPEATATSAAFASRIVSARFMSRQAAEAVAAACFHGLRPLLAAARSASAFPLALDACPAAAPAMATPFARAILLRPSAGVAVCAVTGATAPLAWRARALLCGSLDKSPRTGLPGSWLRRLFVLTPGAVLQIKPPLSEAARRLEASFTVTALDDDPDAVAAWGPSAAAVVGAAAGSAAPGARCPLAALASQARLEVRRGEWLSAALAGAGEAAGASARARLALGPHASCSLLGGPDEHGRQRFLIRIGASGSGSSSSGSSDSAAAETLTLRAGSPLEAALWQRQVRAAAVCAAEQAALDVRMGFSPAAAAAAAGGGEDTSAVSHALSPRRAAGAVRRALGSPTPTPTPGPKPVRAVISLMPPPTPSTAAGTSTSASAIPSARGGAPALAASAAEQPTAEGQREAASEDLLYRRLLAWSAAPRMRRLQQYASRLSSLISREALMRVASAAEDQGGGATDAARGASLATAPPPETWLASAQLESMPPEGPVAEELLGRIMREADDEGLEELDVAVDADDAEAVGALAGASVSMGSETGAGSALAAVTAPVTGDLQRSVMQLLPAVSASGSGAAPVRLSVRVERAVRVNHAAAEALMSCIASEASHIDDVADGDDREGGEDAWMCPPTAALVERLLTSPHMVTAAAAASAAPVAPPICETGRLHPSMHAALMDAPAQAAAALAQLASGLAARCTVLAPASRMQTADAASSSTSASAAGPTSTLPGSTPGSAFVWHDVLGEERVRLLSSWPITDAAYPGEEHMLRLGTGAGAAAAAGAGAGATFSGPFPASSCPRPAEFSLCFVRFRVVRQPAATSAAAAVSAAAAAWRHVLEIPADPLAPAQSAAAAAHAISGAGILAAMPAEAVWLRVLLQ